VGSTLLRVLIPSQESAGGNISDSVIRKQQSDDLADNKIVLCFDI